MTQFPHEIQLNDGVIHFRKWKGKDKKNFINLFKDAQKITLKNTLDTLVHSCVQEDVILSPEEYKYVLSEIRKESLGDDMSITLACESCNHVYDYQYKISEVFVPKHSTLEEFSTENQVVVFGEVRNKELYDKVMEENPEKDILFRIKEYNNEEGYSMDELEEMLLDLDVSEHDQILEYFHENKFRVIDDARITCSKCEFSEIVSFDEMPDFFPDSWFEGANQELLTQERIQAVLNET